MKALPVEPRFLKFVRKLDNGCWKWTGSKNNKGYGNISVNGRPRYAHIVSYELYKGPVTDELRHTCDNSWCVNPEHLVDGTHATNMKDCYQKDRHPIKKLSYEQADEIRSLYATGKYTQTKLAGMYNVSNTTIHLVVNYERRVWHAL